MGDINQEWKELRMKNGNFINHIDGELAKIEKEKKLLDEQKEQNLADTGACAIQLNCCLDDRDILKTINREQVDRIKNLNEKLDKAAADYQALCVENECLKRQLAGAKAQCENTVENRQRISELSQEVIDLKEETFDLQKQLYAAKKETDDFIAMYDKAAAEAHQANVAKDRMGYSNSCMQSKIAKQSNEIKRLIDDNIHLDEYIETLKKKLNELTEETAATKTAYKFLKQALGTSAKDAEANFERGRVKGMVEIWDELKNAYGGRPMPENEKIFGYRTVGEILDNLSPTWFMNKAEEHHKQEEKKARDIQIGDEVEIFDEFDHDLSDVGIVIAIDKDHPCFAVIGPNFEGCFDETDIQDGNVRKTGQHFDSIPLNYFA